MVELVKDMLSTNEQLRPQIDVIVRDLRRQIVILEHGVITTQTINTFHWNTYRWNPYVHEVLGERLSYYFLKGNNIRHDHFWICNSLQEVDVKGFSLYRVIGGIDYILRVWEKINDVRVTGVIDKFRRLHGGQSSKFSVDGFHSISSHLAMSFARFQNPIDIVKGIYNCIQINKDIEEDRLVEGGFASGKLAGDSLRESHPLRLFVALQINDGITNKRVYAREIFDAIEQYRQNTQIAGVSCYYGHDAYAVIVKMRLKKFEDYEEIWNCCIDAVTSVSNAVIVKPDTFLELNRQSISECDDGAIWAEVEKYRRENRLPMPNC